MGAVAKKYEISADSVWRHMRPKEKGGHLTAARRAELACREVIPLVVRQEKDLATQLEIIRNGMFDEYLSAKEAGDFDTAAAASTKFNENAITAARVLDNLKQTGGITVNATINNFAASPSFMRLAEIVLDAVRDFPEARANIVEALRSFNGDAAPLPRPNGPALPKKVTTIECEASHVD
jgi:hypothetical protein